MMMWMMRTESTQNERMAIDIKRMAATVERLKRTPDRATTGKAAGSTCHCGSA